MTAISDRLTISCMTAVADRHGADQPGTSAHVRIRDALTRLESAIEARKGFGHSTHTSTTTLGDGLRCRSTESRHEIATDLPVALGGDGTGPTPGVLLRAALGSCLAMMYRMRAARAGVELRAITVVVESDAAIEGMLRPGTHEPAGFAEIRYRVEIVTDAAAEVVAGIVDEADDLSPLLDAIRRANRTVRSLAVSTGDD